MKRKQTSTPALNEAAKRNKKRLVWRCKIGTDNKSGIRLPGGADSPMRRAVEKAHQELTGVKPEFTFSGWGATLTPIERDCVEDNVKDSYAHVRLQDTLQETWNQYWSKGMQPSDEELKQLFKRMGNDFGEALADGAFESDWK